MSLTTPRSPPPRLPHAQGFCFVKYENQKSTILAVDNFNGIELLGRTIRVDHKHKYSLPAEVRKETAVHVTTAAAVSLLYYTINIKNINSTSTTPTVLYVFYSYTSYTGHFTYPLYAALVLSCVEPGSCPEESTADATVQCRRD